MEITQEANSDASLAVPVLTAYVQAHPKLKAIGTQHGGITSVLTRVPGTDTSTPQGIVTLPFETPGTIQDPRQLRLGGRWSF